MARHTKAGLDFDSEGKPPLDKLITKYMISPRVTMLLIAKAIPEGGKRQVEEVSYAPQAPQPKRKKNNNQKGKNSQASSSQVSGGGAGGGKNPKAKKGKGGGKGKPYVSLPKELVGLNPTSRSGKRVCFAFNLEGCKTPNCSKGEHICMRCGESGHGQRSSQCKGR